MATLDAYYLALERAYRTLYDPSHRPTATKLPARDAPLDGDDPVADPDHPIEPGGVPGAGET
jgi:hypothetical protein